MKKILLSSAVFAIAGAAYVGIKASTTNHESSLLLQNVEAMAMREEDDEWGCAGNPTFTKNESLKSDPCLNGGTHMKCKKKQWGLLRPIETDRLRWHVKWCSSMVIH